MTHIHQAAKAVKTVANHGMSEGMGHMMGGMAGGAAATGALVAVSSHNTRKGIIQTLSRNPVVVFGLGMAAGYLIHKYRKEIISGATRLSEQGKDFVLQQKESLEDLVAECKECEDEASTNDAN
ncbi:MAG: hypothetical protein ACR2HF_05250 [Methylococcaceae bacterium]